MFKHILPNAMVSTLSFLPFIFTGAIGLLTSLDFLGFGLPVGSPSLGELVAQGKNNLSSPWLGLSAFFTLSILLSLLVFIGEAARDAFDPANSNRHLWWWSKIYTSVFKRQARVKPNPLRD